jgi:hypothetical protein
MGTFALAERPICWRRRRPLDADAASLPQMSRILLLSTRSGSITLAKISMPRRETLFGLSGHESHARSYPTTRPRGNADRAIAGRLAMICCVASPWAVGVAVASNARPINTLQPMSRQVGTEIKCCGKEISAYVPRQKRRWHSGGRRFDPDQLHQKNQSLRASFERLLSASFA